MDTKSATSSPHLAHYQKISAIYNTTPLLGARESVQEMLDIMKPFLDIDPENHRVVDVGAGTCQVASRLHRMLEMKHNILCVDPVPEMLAVGEDLPGIDQLCAGAVEFSRVDMSYDRVLMVRMVHHVDRDDLLEMFGNFHKNLNPGGKVLILTGVDNVDEVLLIPAARAARRRELLEPLRKALTEAGFVGVAIKHVSRMFKTTKQVWFDMMRKQFWTCLIDVPKDVIEVQLLQLQKDLQDEEVVEFEAKRVVVTAEK